MLCIRNSSFICFTMDMLRKKIGGFYLVERIGSSGNSEVFVGLNPRTREKRAFKLLENQASFWPVAYTHYLSEVDTIRSLSHQNIINIIEDGILGDCYYYSMECMPGGNLHRRMRRGKISLSAALKLFLPVCDALAYAHGKGVTHRNIKPSNVLFDAAGNPVVSDFGIARNLGAHGERRFSREILGAIGYLAPEQRFGGAKANERADVYALGAMLYQMLMGFPPLGKFPWPCEVQPDFPESVQSVLERCLAFDPARRFENASFLLFELDKSREQVNSETVPAAPAAAAPAGREWSASDLSAVPDRKTDRIETWFRFLRTGTSRDRLAVIREMVDRIEPAEARAVLKLYSGEGDRVRWGLIRVLGELKIESATPLILSDLRSPFHTECVIEALGKIGAEEAYDSVRDYLGEHPEYAAAALLPLANMGKEKSIRYLRRYLGHDEPGLRQAAVRALSSIPAEESLQILKEHLCLEQNEGVRASLFQAVHTLQAILLPKLESNLPNADAFPKTRSL
jgi:hypothetical protein